MARATNPGNIGHAWVKALWIDRQAAPGMERPEECNPPGLRFYSGAVFRQSDLRCGQEFSEDAAGSADEFETGVLRWELGSFCGTVLRPRDGTHWFGVAADEIVPRGHHAVGGELLLAEQTERRGSDCAGSGSRVRIEMDSAKGFEGTFV